MPDDHAPPRDDAPLHALPPDAALARLETAETGLSSAEAEARLKRHGPNALPGVKPRPAWLRFLLHFHNMLIYVLIAAAAITAWMEHYVDTVVILAVVVVNAIVGFVQEGRAEAALSAIRSMLAPRASVLRDGRRVGVDAAELVPGDIVLLESGDRVPADLRLLSARGLRIEEAILTGESVPTDKSTEATPPDVALAERHGMAFSGTLTVAGAGQGVVVATGTATEVGRIGTLLGGVEQLTTPLVEQMDAFARWLTVLILVVAGLVLAFGYFLEHLAFDEVFMAVVGLAVAAVPAGLPAVLTVTLAVGVRAMAARNAIVRRLPAIETLGAVSVICSDKTGTLTRNEMTVATVALATGEHVVEGDGYAPHGHIRHADGAETDPATVAAIARAALLCNDAALHEDGGRWRAEGDPMEAALLAFAGKAGQTAEGWRRRDVLPFDSVHRYMAVLAEGPKGARVLVKGAPEKLLGMAADQAGADGAESLDRAFWQAEADRIAARGQRVLALAEAEPSGEGLDPKALDGRLRLLGLLGLIDPPRPEAVEAVAICHDAGIRVKMITGDHAGTAAAIGRQIGLANPDRVLTGVEIDGMDDTALADAVETTDVFARTSPEHKLRLVTALQADGLTVAMTGDGVNDAPALKRADAGIAMGRKGSEAAKEASELVLADDNFASIAAAVQEGRTVFDNIRKVISWTLPTNAGEAATIMVALLFGLALPVNALQILWINMITAVTLGLALAFEPTEAGTMLRAPRARGEALLGPELVWHCIFVTLLFLAAAFGVYAYAIDRGDPVPLARTMAMNMIVVLEVFHLFFIRNIHGTSLTWAAVRGTKPVWLCLFIVVLAQLAITYIPVLNVAFGTAPMDLMDGALIVGLGVVFFVILEVEKQIKLVLGVHPGGVAPVAPRRAARHNTAAR